MGHCLIGTEITKLEKKIIKAELHKNLVWETSDTHKT